MCDMILDLDIYVVTISIGLYSQQASDNTKCYGLCKWSCLDQPDLRFVTTVNLGWFATGGGIHKLCKIIGHVDSVEP